MSTSLEDCFSWQSLEGSVSESPFVALDCELLTSKFVSWFPGGLNKTTGSASNRTPEILQGNRRYWNDYNILGKAIK